MYNRTINPRTISGFPEFLPEEEKLLQGMIDKIRHTYESYGFSRIETPAVELNEVLTAKGGIDAKEIFALKRLQSSEDDDSKDYSLHFDLTVPLARYVAQHHQKLSFPFRRHQIQKVWRGERPQEGRFREFYQCDIDVIGDGELSLLADAEIPAIIYDIFSQLDIGEFRIRINNRKILQGLFQSLGINTLMTSAVLRVIDRIEKAGTDKVISELLSMSLEKSVIENLLEIIKTNNSGEATISMLGHSKIDNDCFQAGCDELLTVIRNLKAMGVPEDAYKVDLSIARGLDYYTGTIYETTLVNHPGIGSICSGGRYDNLASYYTDKKLPGVGISIGLTRLFSRLLKAGLVTPRGSASAHVLIAKLDNSLIPEYLSLASVLRKKGVKTEIYLEDRSLSAQLKYADKKGLPFIIIAGREELSVNKIQFKNMKTGEQTTVTIDNIPSEINSNLDILKQKGLI